MGDLNARLLWAAAPLLFFSTSVDASVCWLFPVMRASFTSDTTWTLTNALFLWTLLICCYLIAFLALFRWSVDVIQMLFIEFYLTEDWSCFSKWPHCPLYRTARRGMLEIVHMSQTPLHSIKSWNVALVKVGPLSVKKISGNPNTAKITTTTILTILHKHCLCHPYNSSVS